MSPRGTERVSCGLNNAYTRREARLEQLTKERDALVKSKKEIKQKYEAADVFVFDFAKVGLYQIIADMIDYECGRKQG
jgi:hypothetical protein